MFGLKQVEQIAEGWAKDIVNAEKELYNKRMPICKKCPLFTDDVIFHGKCDAKKYYNPQTGEISTLPSKGFINGCGCVCSKKVRVKSAKCVLDRWK